MKEDLRQLLTTQKKMKCPSVVKQQYFLVKSKKTITITSQLVNCGDQQQKFMTIICDITSIKSYEYQKQLSEFKTIYFAQIAHDLRTPLHTVLTVNANLSKSVGQSCKKLLEISNSSCNFLLTTIDDVFDLSKIELN